MGGPFDVRVIGDVGPGGDVAHSNGVRYEVDVFPAKSASWRLSVDMPLRPVTTAERDSATAAIMKRFRVVSINQLPAPVRTAYEATPSSHPPLSRIKVLRDGTVWIRPTPAVGASAARWDVFSRDGTRLGRASLPLTSWVWDGDRNWVLISELGEDDVPRFVRYRMTR